MVLMAESAAVAQSPAAADIADGDGCRVGSGAI
jgi:hypothetical protein